MKTNASSFWYTVTSQNLWHVRRSLHSLPLKQELLFSFVILTHIGPAFLSSPHVAIAPHVTIAPHIHLLTSLTYVLPSLHVKVETVFFPPVYNKGFCTIVLHVQHANIICHNSCLISILWNYFQVPARWRMRTCQLTWWMGWRHHPSSYLG